jgi:hypothetical protein
MLCVSTPWTLGAFICDAHAPLTIEEAMCCCTHVPCYCTVVISFSNEDMPKTTH